MRGISKASCLPTLCNSGSNQLLHSVKLKLSYLKVQDAAIKVGHTPVPALHGKFSGDEAVQYFLAQRVGAIKPVKHVEFEVVRKMLGNPFPFRLFEAGKPGFLRCENRQCRRDRHACAELRLL